MQRVLAAEPVLVTVMMEEANREREGPRGFPVENCLSLPPGKDAGEAAGKGPLARCTEKTQGERVASGRGGDMVATCPTGRLLSRSQLVQVWGKSLYLHLTHPGYLAATSQ